MTDVTALRALLTDLEASKDRLEDECFGRLLCGLHGVPFGHVGRMGNGLFVSRTDTEMLDPATDVYSNRSRHRCPDVDLQAADDLVKEVLPDYARRSGRSGEGCWAVLKPPKVDGASVIETLESYSRAEHPTSEPVAIMIALTKALIAQAELEVEHA